ncbi:flagellar hook-basal body protein [Kurthia sibirica]|uniref:Flagellar biosynthesis protein FlgG n=1 Tax=Kurthia sibirica TaxID=202750 RepID=A0A2U3AL23_9BACL|nr:flagellar hook-basal body protein [Kurthia sibirica]PWI25192.1 flagellar biosynthesis protein FlgG [Kurthia sibirica]GEK33279.1 flagellar hook-basal body complex protein FlhO [Kurthia sibirica]
MFRGFYTASSGMIAQQRRTEMLSNNISNANTPGFKADQSTVRSFPDMLMSAVQKKGNASLENGFNPSSIQTIGGLNTGVYLQETLPNFMQGSIVETSNNTDLALLNGDLPTNAETGEQASVFFTVQAEDGGQAYTRNGNFTLDGEGFLTTPNGNYVLDDENARIQLQNDDFKVTKNGDIIVENQRVARIGIAYSETPYELAKKNNGLFFTPNNTNLPNAYTVPNISFSTEQGYTEGSNVDSAQTMTDMMTAYRAFEANQKVLQAYDRSMEKAVNEIGRV